MEARRSPNELDNLFAEVGKQFQGTDGDLAGAGTGTDNRSSFERDRDRVRHGSDNVIPPPPPRDSIPTTFMPPGGGPGVLTSHALSNIDFHDPDEVSFGM